MIKYLSVCSGIEAASVAWSEMPFEPVAFSEIEAFPSEVLAQRFPQAPNLGDMTKHDEWKSKIGAIDLLVGGTPCQSFSVAGSRKSLGDERGNLCLTFCRIADQFNPEWVLWENVPGALSTKDNAFGCFVGELCGADGAIIPEGKWSNCGVVSGPKRTVPWRVLDAQWFGVAQRRRRVFVLASRGHRNYGCANALLPIGESLPWYIKASGGKRDQVAELVGKSPQEPMYVGGYDSYNCGHTSGQRFGRGLRKSTVSPTVIANGPSIISIPGNVINRRPEHGGNGCGFSSHGVAYTQTRADVHAVCYENHPSDSRLKELKSGVSSTVTSKWGTGGGNTNIAVHLLQDPISSNDVSPCIGGMGQATVGVVSNYSVRRFTPIECERLQGFPDNWTRIAWKGKSDKECPDSHRYKAIGNSIAVPVMRWIGARILSVSERRA